MYKSLLKPILFSLSPENAHHFVAKALKFILRIPGKRRIIESIYLLNDVSLKTKVFGLEFPNPVGLAAGFDKDAKMFDELSSFGFGFVEVGTVTPKAQDGNPKPRLFRLPEDNALINRMGFNNEGVEAMVTRLKDRKTNVIIGGNIGKNKLTPNENAADDYRYSFNALFDHVDYFVVNVSSPNTPNLRELQDKEPLTKLLMELQGINQRKQRPKPILLKIAPDLNQEQLDDIVEIVRDSKIQGIIATNTTIDRENLQTDQKTLNAIGNGGLSGKPLTHKSTEVIAYLAKKSKKSYAIIGVGGIHSAEDALEKLEAGADLVQIYTGFIYEGPALVKKINKAIIKKRKDAKH